MLRRANPFFVLMTPAGDVVRTWGENLFKVAHGLRIDRKGFLWVTDNTDNFVQKYSPDGKLLLTLGQRGVAGGNDSKTGFDGPADVFVLPDGDILVADGYRNSRVVRFASDGSFKSIIGGAKGTEPGQFNVPHAVVADSRGRIIVADAENSRIQVFDQSGKFLEQWTDFTSKPRGSTYITPDDAVRESRGFGVDFDHEERQSDRARHRRRRTAAWRHIGSARKHLRRQSGKPVGQEDREEEDRGWLKPDTTSEAGHYDCSCAGVAWRLLVNHAWELVRGSLRCSYRSSLALDVVRPTTHKESPSPFSRCLRGKLRLMSALTRGRTRTSSTRGGSTLPLG